jgi:hypothetical protein
MASVRKHSKLETNTSGTMIRWWKKKKNKTAAGEKLQQSKTNNKMKIKEYVIRDQIRKINKNSIDIS